MTIADITGFADGGYGVARVDGLVHFVRHALPGERVVIEVVEKSGSFNFAEATEVLTPHPERREPVCPVAVPGGCGGCSMQHASDGLQLRLKSDVLTSTFSRLAGVSTRIEVESVAPRFAWRTRMQYHEAPDGTVGLRRWKSHDVVALPPEGCAIASPQAQPGARPQGPTAVRVAGRTWTIPSGAFWQVHPAAPDVLTEAVTLGLAPRPGEVAWDLYCGVGLFSGPLADAGAQVWGSDGNARAVAAAGRNVTEGKFQAGRIEAVVKRWPDPNIVVCDPPRAGLDKPLLRELLRRGPRAIAYVSCHPASLAGKLPRFFEAGYELTSLRAFDLFPQTPHVECVAILERAAAPGRQGESGI